MSFCNQCKASTKTDIDYTTKFIECYAQVGRRLTCERGKRNVFTREEILNQLNSEVRKLKKYTHQAK